ncbi:2-hydroxy-3-keto-5-methylthiopentenyl-1-phosphate phosphatase [Paenibacillus sp. GCM10023248]|uniref:2-hydroxy-3-keto-5-methylthiopentenyl-1- phosphate phosphatase n=1 Tax=Bacillales TaxID=1385 RepID=UPI002379F63A|nr:MULTISPECIES: 2-hydroxy-3-keto-5-methylthiopentenyl-1-phosphate phosphatase [Bacillales]MDD9267694.1 2-hydroxy-3-keto-5-methylthiopentenyl-1-phosphate phosphatase [Paenibacillus sp. MAHUQ-63]MDR6884506.1 2-hydroxy-3-keto-5-methylthiopentenyl-1-phosphate phosphatase [Bacillus sp. 3255]
MSKERIIFCDFDGTITVNDNIVAIMKHFNPDGWEAIVERILNKTISISQGVGAMFALLPTSRKDEIVDYAISNAVIRDGFKEFVAYCQEQGIKLLITSGGIDFFIYPLLKPFPIPHENIYCNASSFEGSAIEILWPHSCDEHCHTGCGMCKTSIIRSYDSSKYERIIIGDSITDFEGAKLVDTIFARSHLIEMCEKLGYAYYPFENFFDIMKQLEAEPVA